jgi:glycosyltransferase involved in cell wall biosynthesis
LPNSLIGGKCKLVFTEHNTTNRRIQKSYFKFIEQFIYSRYKKIVCISDEIYSIYKKYLPKFESRFVIINNGVNLETIRTAGPIDKSVIHHNIENSDKLILQVSAFRPQKDQKTLIKAMGLLSENVALLLVGDGETKQECEKLVASMSLEKRVFFVGQRMDIPQILKTADIIVLSSKYEGLSLSSIEGMASGKPFVASDVPGLSDVVKDAGILFELGSSEELAKIILKLLHNKNYYDSVANTCQIRAANYDIKIMVDKHIDLYERILKK